MHDRVVGLLDPVPASVTVHGIVAPHHGCYFSDADPGDFRFKLRQIFAAALWWGIAAIQQAVDKDIVQPFAPGQLQKGVKVRVVGVYSAVGKQA